MESPPPPPPPPTKMAECKTHGLVEFRIKGNSKYYACKMCEKVRKLEKKARLLEAGVPDAYCAKCERVQPRNSSGVCKQCKSEQNADYLKRRRETKSPGCPMHLHLTKDNKSLGLKGGDCYVCSRTYDAVMRKKQRQAASAKKEEEAKDDFNQA